jgi:hypothetical protein
LRWLDDDVAVVPLLRTSSCLGDAGLIRFIEDKCEESVVTSPCDSLDESDHWGHLLHHFVHGFCVCGRLPDDDVKGFAAMTRLTV